LPAETEPSNRQAAGSGDDQGAGGQSAVLDFLGDPAAYGAGIETVKRIDTHGAIVFLAGQSAYKVKRAVAYPYMDFSTLERRRTFCARERDINSRTAPDLYRDVIPVTEDAQGLHLGGDGRPVEWVLVMRRFDEAGLLSRLAETGALTAEIMTALADAVAEFHAAAEVKPAISGGAKAMDWVLRENGEEFAERPDLFDAADAEALTQTSLDHLKRHAALLDSRAEAGQVRLCHGDLHLRNVVLLDGRPTLFDAIEFNDAIACIDVAYDLAFLLMDLDHRALRPFANLVLNRYLQRSDDLEALALLPMFLSARAAVRAKVAASLEAIAGDPALKARQREEAGAYFRLAQSYLEPVAPELLAVGGLSGSGKTSLARTLAPDIGAAPGALHLRSDVLRKSLAGVPELEQLPPAAYTREASVEVYSALARGARRGLSAGHAVVVDAVFAHPKERHDIEQVAQDAGVPFTGLWLDADAAVLTRRVAARRGDASDATAAVVEQQLAYDLGVIEWRRLDSAQPPDLLRDSAARLIRRKP
jgi:uncharacterized protein